MGRPSDRAYPRQEIPRAVHCTARCPVRRRVRDYDGPMPPPFKGSASHERTQPPASTRPRCQHCGAQVAPAAPICSMCHVARDVAKAPTKGPGPRVTLPSIGGLLSSITGLIAYDRGIVGRPARALQQYHEAQTEAETREQTFFLGAMAEAQSGKLKATQHVQSNAEAPDPGPMPDDGHWVCPRTQSKLQATTVAGAHMHVNPDCGGMLLERASELYLMQHPELWEQVISAAEQLAARASRHVDGKAMVYLSCPTCGGPMVRKNFEKVSGIMVDTCPKHGTWFDAGELPEALRFLQGSGKARRAAFEAREAQYISEQRRSIQRIEARTRRNGPGHSAEAFFDPFD